RAVDGVVGLPQPFLLGVPGGDREVVVLDGALGLDGAVLADHDRLGRVLAGEGGRHVGGVGLHRRRDRTGAAGPGHELVVDLDEAPPPVPRVAGVAVAVAGRPVVPIGRNPVDPLVPGVVVPGVGVGVLVGVLEGVGVAA